MAGCRPQHTARWASAAASGCRRMWGVKLGQRGSRGSKIPTSQLFWYLSRVPGFWCSQIWNCAKHASGQTKWNLRIWLYIYIHLLRDSGPGKRYPGLFKCLATAFPYPPKSNYFARVLQNTSLRSTTVSDALISCFLQSCWRNSTLDWSLVFHVSYPMIVKRGWLEYLHSFKDMYDIFLRCFPPYVYCTSIHRWFSHQKNWWAFQPALTLLPDAFVGPHHLAAEPCDPSGWVR